MLIKSADFSWCRLIRRTETHHDNRCVPPPAVVHTKMSYRYALQESHFKLWTDLLHDVVSARCNMYRSCILCLSYDASVRLSVRLWRLCTVVTGCDGSRIPLHAWIDGCLYYLLTTPDPDRRMGYDAGISVGRGGMEKVVLSDWTGPSGQRAISMLADYRASCYAGIQYTTGCWLLSYTDISKTHS